MIRYVGLDGEMTGQFKNGGKLCQMGVAFDIENIFCKDVGWDRKDLFCEPGAMKIHGLTEDYLAEEADYHTKVDGVLSHWLECRGASNESRSLVPVGWNVARWDMPFVEDALPISNEYFSRRTIDLNAIVYYLDRKVYYNGSYPSYKGWKRMSKAYAQAKLLEADITPDWHNAGYDAIAALLSLEFLQGVLKWIGSDETTSSLSLPSNSSQQDDGEQPLALVNLPG